MIGDVLFVIMQHIKQATEARLEVTTSHRTLKMTNSSLIFTFAQRTICSGSDDIHKQCTSRTWQEMLTDSLNEPPCHLERHNSKQSALFPIVFRRNATCHY